MAQTQKKYEYDEVIDFTSGGSSLDGALQQIQEDAKALRELIDRAQPLYHGKGTGSTVYKQYNVIYNNIGSSSKRKGLWNIAKRAVELQNFMYNNAVYDKQTDEENAVAGQYGL